MNPTRPLRDDVTDLSSRVRALESRTTILVCLLAPHKSSLPLTPSQGVEQAYDATMAAQGRQASFKAVSLIHSEMTESSKTTAVLEAELEKTKKELEKTKHGLIEEIKRRKGLEMKVDMMFEWFKSQQK